MSTVDIKYCDGQLRGLSLYDPERISLTDCRERQDVAAESFISLTIRDDQVGMTAYLTPELAEELHAELGKLFVIDTAIQDAETAAPAV